MRTSPNLSLLRLLPILSACAATTCALPLRAQCGPFDDQKLGASNPLPNALYGYSLDLSGTRAIVGAYNEGPSGAGAVYFLVHNGSNWVEEQRVQPGGAFGEFGRSVALSGDTAAIATPFAVDQVRVYRRGASQWAPEQTLAPFGSGNAGQFGRSLDVDGDVIAAGSHNAASSAASNTGRAWVWRRSGTTWTQSDQLVAPDAAQGDAFAWSLALSGDWVVCGAVEDDNDKGSAYLFRYNGANWVFDTKLQPSDLGASARFGQSVDVSGDALVVGAYTDTGGGSVYVFRRSAAGVWNQEAKLLPSGPEQHGYGRTVALSGDELLVQDHFGSYVERWRRMSGNWLPIGRLLASSASNNSAYLGEDLAVSGSLALLGDHEDDQLGDRAGAVYAFDLASYNGVCTYCTAQTSSQGCVSAITSSGSPSATSGSGFILNAANLAPGQVGRFIYSTQIGYSFTTLANGGTICMSDPTRNTPLSSTGGAAACSGVLSFDFNAWVATGNDPALAIGAIVRGQFWSRDVGNPSRNITDAVSFVVFP